ncbi:exodeoxyribonuclease VII small subunit [Butyrivibrio sp. NC3005]|uniref:exodeoxyribonuclease VII small subunit n=1 Tax=Butyrivibrio sp. NC3005 TaxID=1280685 RepID=UPI000402FF35|nr:exodeoxyribonuclease VII small subunit [Butyrivibrio sp. NC3005]
MNKENSFENISIEDALKMVDETISSLQKEDISLEESFRRYEQGMKLLKYCNDEIEQVEQKVMKIAGDSELVDFE